MRYLMLVATVAAIGTSAQAQTCTRDGLKAMAANYFKAVETHNVSVLPVSANVRITENAAEIKPGEGFFKTGGKPQLQRTIVDTGRCSALTQAVVEESANGVRAGSVGRAIDSERGQGERN